MQIFRCDFPTVNDNNNERHKLWFVIRILNGILDANNIEHQKKNESFYTLH